MAVRVGPRDLVRLLEVSTGFKLRWSVTFVDVEQWDILNAP